MKSPKSGVATHELPRSFNLETPFNPLYVNNEYPLSEKPEIVSTIEEILDIEATLSGDIDLNYIVWRIKTNDYSFVTTGLWLWKVRYYKSYLKTHKRFKDWCQDVVGKNYTTCLDMIYAAIVWIELVSFGFDILPTSIAQCLVLKDLNDEELRDAWSTVLEELEPHQFSSGRISTLLNGSEENVNTSVSLPIELFYKLYQRAVDYGITIIEVIAQMYDEIHQKVAYTPPNAMRFWEQDLKLLVMEHQLGLYDPEDINRSFYRDVAPILI